MKKIVITEFMDESAVDSLSTAFNVVYDPKLVDDTTRLMAFVADADGIIGATVPKFGATY
jgi:(S)-sulfolactate dehydrogenase